VDWLSSIRSHSARRAYSHNFDTAYKTTARQRAALCLMLLRGPQTLNELFTHC